MAELITKAEFARRCGITDQAIYTYTKSGNKLFDAMVGDRIDAEHIVARTYYQKRLEKNGNQPYPDIPPARTGRPRQRAIKTGASNVSQIDVTDPAIKILERETDPDKLRQLTIEEVAIKYGHISVFKDYMSSLKAIADYDEKITKTAERKGTLIPRDVVSKHILPLIDLNNKRLVEDFPDSVTEVIVAKVRNDPENAVFEVTNYIRTEISKILKGTKDQAIANLKEFQHDSDE